MGGSGRWSRLLLIAGAVLCTSKSARANVYYWYLTSGNSNFWSVNTNPGFQPQQFGSNVVGSGFLLSSLPQIPAKGAGNCHGNHVFSPGCLPNSPGDCGCLAQADSDTVGIYGNLPLQFTSQDVNDLSPFTGFQTPTPFGNFDAANGTDLLQYSQSTGAQAFNDASGTSHWGFWIWGNECAYNPGSCTTNHTCDGSMDPVNDGCGMNHWVNLNAPPGQAPGTDVLFPWSSGFGSNPVLNVGVHYEINNWLASTVPTSRAHGYLCANLHDESTGQGISYCAEPWGSTPPTNQGTCTLDGYSNNWKECTFWDYSNNYIVFSFFAPGTIYVQQMSGSATSVMNGPSVGVDNWYGMQITKQNLLNAINDSNYDMDHYPAGACAPGQHQLSTDPITHMPKCMSHFGTDTAKWTMTGLQTGGEGQFKQLGGNTSQLQAYTTFDQPDLMNAWGPVGTNLNGTLELFAVSGGQLWHKWQTSPGGPWSYWVLLGGSVTDTPAVARNLDGTLEVFVRWSDGSVRRIKQVTPAGSWGSFVQFPGTQIVGSPVVAVNQNGALEVFTIASGGYVWHAAQSTPGNDNTWPTGFWSLLPTNIAATGTLAVARNQSGTLELFTRAASDSHIYHIWQATPGGSWYGAWVSLGGAASDSPSATINADGRLEVFYAGTDGALWHSWQLSPAGGWSAASSLGGAGISAKPAAVRNGNGTLEVFVNSSGTVSHIWQSAAGSSTWATWFSLGTTSGPRSPVSAMNATGTLDVLYVDNAGTAWHDTQTAPAAGWTGFQSLAGTVSAFY